MGTRRYGKYALVPVFLACSALGAWATIGTCIRQGLAEAIRAVLEGERPALVGAPAPFKLRYVGLGPVDRLLGTTVAFFSALLDGDVPGETALATTWCLAQFGAGWAVLMLESLRAGNRDRALGGPGGLVIFGLLCQTCTWTFTLPLYLALHLFTSPVADMPRPGTGPAARRRLFVFLWDLALVPTSVTLAFVLPAVLMAMPDFLAMSPAAHYKIMALWQLFPVLNVVVHAVLHAVGSAAFGSLRPTDARGRPAALGAAYLTAVAGVYQFALALCVLVHVPLLALTLVPAPLRATLAAAWPARADLIAHATFARVFVPAAPSAAPAVDPASYASGDLAALAAHFLRCDVLIASVPFLLWALYVSNIRCPLLPPLVSIAPVVLPFFFLFFFFSSSRPEGALKRAPG